MENLSEERRNIQGSWQSLLKTEIRVLWYRKNAEDCQNLLDLGERPVLPISWFSTCRPQSCEKQSFCHLEPPSLQFFAMRALEMSLLRSVSFINLACVEFCLEWISQTPVKCLSVKKLLQCQIAGFWNQESPPLFPGILNRSHFGKNLAIIPVVSLKEWVDRGPCFYFSFLNAVEPFLLNALGLQSKSTVNSFQRPQDWKRSQPVRKETNRLHTSSSRRVFSFFAGSKYERPWDLCLEEVSGTWPYTDLPGGEAPTFCELCRFTDDLINVCQIHGDCWNHPSSPIAAFDI